MFDNFFQISKENWLLRQYLKKKPIICDNKEKEDKNLDFLKKLTFRFDNNLISFSASKENRLQNLFPSSGGKVGRKKYQPTEKGTPAGLHS